MQNRAKGRPKRPHRYGIRDIARIVGKSMPAVEMDKLRGKLDMRDLTSVAHYIVTQLNKRKKPCRLKSFKSQ